jgi:hypothetical protein
MAERVRIDCVNKTGRTDPHDRISYVGGPKASGRWRLPEAEAISGIESGRFIFYVERPAGQFVEVVVASRLGRRYLKTTGDGEQPDNLLSLPECT